MSKRQALPPESAAVIYARYSSNAQREESIEGQLRECHEYARRNGLTVINEYVDKAMTGRTDQRPSFLKMISDSASHSFQYVICWKLDRFSRDRYDSAVYKHKLKKNGVKVIYAREAIPEGPEGKILESVMEGLAEYYSDNLAQNIRRGLTDSAMQRKAMGKLPFGYRKSRDGFYELDPETAPAATRIFKDYAAGVSALEICEWLNASGYKTGSGGVFGRSAIPRIVRNEKYLGVYKWSDIEAAGAIPAITDRETFEACQRRANAKRHAPAASRDTKYALTGKVKCGLCGGMMTGESCRSKTGKMHYYYTCFNRKKRMGCKAARLYKDETEAYVFSVLSDLVKSPDFVEDVADAVTAYIERENADAGEIQALTRRLKDVEKRHGNMLRAIEMGIVTEGTKARLMELEDELSKTRTAIAREELKTPRFTREHIIYFLERMAEQCGEDLADAFLDSVYFYEDHVDFCLNYTKNSEPVSFTDYRAAAFGVRLLEYSVDWLRQKANLFPIAGHFILRVFETFHSVPQSG